MKRKIAEARKRLKRKLLHNFLNETNWKMCIWLRNWFIAPSRDSIFKLTQFACFIFLNAALGKRHISCKRIVSDSGSLNSHNNKDISMTLKGQTATVVVNYKLRKCLSNLHQ